MEGAEQRRHDVGPGADACAYHHAPALECLNVIHYRAGFSKQCKEPFSVMQQFLARRSQYDPPAMASEEPQTQRLLECLDLLCDGRLGEIKSFCSSGIAEMLCYWAKHSELMHCA